MTADPLMRRRVVLVAVTIVAVAMPVLLACFFASPLGRGWSEALSAATDSWERGIWRVLRGGIKWIAPPVVVIATAVCLVHLVRSGAKRQAVIAVTLGAGSFATSEAIKHGFIPFPAYGPAGERELSGHVAMVASAMLLAVLATGPSRRRAIALLCWALLTGTCLVIIISRWHDTADVVLPVSISVAWMVAGLTLVRLVDAAAAPRAPVDRRRSWRAPAAFAGACAVAAGLLVGIGDAATVGSPTQTLVATGLAILATTTSATLVATSDSGGIERGLPTSP